MPSLFPVMRKSLSSSILHLCLLLSLLHSSYASATLQKSSLTKGSSLSVEDESYLVSPNESFACGFYKVGINAYSFSIWSLNTANKTVVWTANWGRPVNGRGSRISVKGNGDMVLTDVNGSTVWNSNTVRDNIDRAELTGIGNLVIKELNGNIVWQSFDAPTNTLLPWQNLTKAKRLVSARGKPEISSGYYNLFFDSDNVLKLMYDGPEITRVYWPNPDLDAWRNGRTLFNSSRLAILADIGQFLSSDRLKVYASDFGYGITRRLKLDYDGNLRLYSLMESTGVWQVSWVALPQQCNVHGLCGRYGVCVYTPVPKCSCPTGYEMSDPRDWSKGCMPKFNQTCNTQEVKFIQLPYSDYYGFDLNYSANISLESCKKICLQNCRCEAFQYRLDGKGNCWAKSSLFGGRHAPNLPGTIYVKLPKSLESGIFSDFKVSEPMCKETDVLVGPDVFKKSKSRDYLQFLWFALSVGVVELMFIATSWWYLFKERGMPALLEEGYRVISNQFRKFTYTELTKATNDFKEELGRGGSGSVYKGVLADRREVSVKKLRGMFQCEEEFWAEVSMIGRINHINLVRMWGYCSENEHRLLVSEYVENGSLDKYLFSEGSSIQHAKLLSWNERFKIAMGTAKGLAYLHHRCLEWVIHCDVKPENILLGRDFEPKIADFGLAKLSQRGRPGSNLSHVRGTKGYMAPEWTLNLPITGKVDVYSYGVVLLEIVRGRRFCNCVADREEKLGLKSYIQIVKEKKSSGGESWILDLVDARLNGEFDQKQAAAMVELGITCVEEERSRRPNMDMIVEKLLACHDNGILCCDGSLQQSTDDFYSARSMLDSLISLS